MWIGRPDGRWIRHWSGTTMPTGFPSICTNMHRQSHAVLAKLLEELVGAGRFERPTPCAKP